MIYFCADDYGISYEGNRCIENCLRNGVLNKVSVLPNGKIKDLKECFSDNDNLSLHLNLVEGRAFSKHSDAKLLVSEDGCFKHSFIGLYLLSLSFNRKKLEKQIYNELKKQISFWKEAMGSERFDSIDSHQHTHMIPLVFKVLMRVVRDEGIDVELIRIPNEPIMPYILTPSLYFSYSLSGIVKQWLLKFFALINRNEFKKAKIKTSYFMGVMFSGKMKESNIKKILPHYIKLSEKHGKDIELGFHPAYVIDKNELIKGNRKGFNKFYLSPWRKTEYDTLMNFKLK